MKLTLGRASRYFFISFSAGMETTFALVSERGLTIAHPGSAPTTRRVVEKPAIVAETFLSLKIGAKK